MNEPFVADMRNFIETAEPEAKPSRAVARVRKFLGAIVEAATMATPGIATKTALVCRRRPGRMPCSGILEVQLTEVPPRILWNCSGCGDAGTVTHWQGTPWDLSSRRRSAEAVPLEILLTLGEYEGLQEIGILDDTSQALVRSAKPSQEGILLSGMPDELEDLCGFVTAEASHRRQDTNRETLRGIASKIQDRIGPLEF